MPKKYTPKNRQKAIIILLYKVIGGLECLPSFNEKKYVIVTGKVTATGN